jgi:hypothetical protein
LFQKPAGRKNHAKGENKNYSTMGVIFSSRLIFLHATGVKPGRNIVTVTAFQGDQAMTNSKVSFRSMLRVSVLAGLAGTLVACGSMTHYNHEVALGANGSGDGGDAKQGKAVLMDAKQRTVFAIPGKTKVNGTDVDVMRVCAEASPDALSALAASSDNSLSTDTQLALKAAFTLSETASNIGLRTQSIQLMRDAGYRLCEAAVSGNLSQSQFEMLQRHYQNSMVTILAVEQLTGTVRGGNVELSTTASLGSAKEIAALTQSAAEAKATADKAVATAAEKKAAVSTAEAKVTTYLADKGGTETGLSDAQKTELAPLKKAVSDAQAEQIVADNAATVANEKLTIYQAGLNAIGAGNQASSGTARASGGSGSNTLTGDSAIATAVKDMVSDQINSGFFRDACATLFIAQIDGRVDNTKLGGLDNECYQVVKGDYQSRAKIRESHAESYRLAFVAYNILVTAYADCLKRPACAAKAPPPPVLPPFPPVPDDSAPMMVPLSPGQ